MRLEDSDSASLGSNPSAPASQNVGISGEIDARHSGQPGTEGVSAPHENRHSRVLIYGNRPVVFIGMETSGALRRRFQAAGFEAYSCDLLPAEDCAAGGHHIIGDVFDTLAGLRAKGLAPSVAIFHPTCTYHAVSAAWAFADPDFARYPGSGYHQRVRPGTLVGAARRAAREKAEADLEAIRLCGAPLIVVENPRGTIGTRLPGYGAPCDVLQPYEFGDDASKATCLWAFDGEGRKVPMRLSRVAEKRVRGRFIRGVERWSNQTDTGQNRLSPSDNRWKERARTYPGIADALVAHFFRLPVSPPPVTADLLSFDYGPRL